MAVNSKYHHSCINCGGLNTDERNERGLPCEVCLPEESPSDIYGALLERKTLKEYRFYHEFWNEYEDFRSFFKKKFGKDLTGYQRLWAKRIIQGKSFTMVAPTGVGKTTFGMMTALWLAEKGRKSALIFPTVALVKQTLERLQKFSDGKVKILGFYSSMKKEEKEKFEKSFEEDDYHILVFSTQFVSKNREKLSQKRFDFVFVDDVDAVLKASRNIDTLLMMVGIPEEIIKKAFSAIKQGRIYERPKNLKPGILVVSSATAKPRGIRPLLFRDLLNFTVGRLVSVARNITHVRISSRSKEKLVELLEVFRDGILIFAQTEEEGKELYEYLRRFKFNVGETWSEFEKNFEDFKSGKLNVLIGVQAYYGKLTRGVDLPERIKYAIFWGTPSMRFSLELDRVPRFVLARVLKEMGLIKVQENPDVEGLRKMAKERLSQEEFVEKVKEIFRGAVVKDEDLELIIPDVYTYIQASGRSSRILNGVLVKGVSVIFEEDEEIFESLKTRLLLIAEEEIIEESEANWKELVHEVEESRKRIEGELTDTSKSLLIIVESPTKAETLSRFLGRASSRKERNIIVHEAVTGEGVVLFTATRGHVYDLVTRGGIHGVEEEDGKFVPVYNSLKRCRDCGYQFTEDRDECPVCSSKNIDDKTETLRALREISLEADEILVATDPDVEGEKISWDVTQYLLPATRSLRRIEMHEITRYGFKKARENVRFVDFNLVKAQIVRRVQDRWIGFELSGKLQKRFGRSNLSAGRVQSTVLGWIVEREEEYKKSEKDFTLLVLENGVNLEVEGKIADDVVTVVELQEVEEERNPLPPYTTSSALSEISQKLRLGVQEVMDILQDLFEKGFITYHRTDSTRISLEGQNVARTYLKKIGKEDIFMGRSWSTEGAHEAIRPVKPIDARELEEMVEEGLIADLTKKHLRVYELIFNRFLASQSAAVKVKKQIATVELNGKRLGIEQIIEVLKNGWNLFVPLTVSPRFEHRNYKIKEKKFYKKHTVPLFTQASIVEEMKKRGIGRPSTYAKIVEVLFRRGYVYEDKYKRVRPTRLGVKVYSYLKERYEKYVTEETTRRLEEIMDKVERGEEDYQATLRLLYEEIKSLMEEG
ncbi:reverse gyrase [Thermotoga sp. 38H-to]|uniref:reverse gyrase n=1 Tax=Thermotoga sp. 38H-to TaxID=1755812 RepID=UPI0013EDD861|nr:reverse gyrase [Thermotoga sp. 38H-to]